jgi:hypothetical protein
MIHLWLLSGCLFEPTIAVHSAGELSEGRGIRMLGYNPLYS